MSKRSGIEVRKDLDGWTVSYRVTEGSKRNAIYAQEKAPEDVTMDGLRVIIESVWKKAVDKRFHEAGRASRKMGSK